MTGRNIELRGVAVHNLKQVDLDIPLHKLVVLCGVSGSGKSSLAFDTLFAEGQRRYIESFSIYARQFLQRLDKPEAERIDGIPASIAVTRGDVSRSSRTTIGATTETLDYLRLLYSRVAKLFCPICGQSIQRTGPQAAAEQLSQLPDGTRLMVGFATSVGRDSGRPQSTPDLVAELKEQGFIRVIAGDRTQSLADDAKASLPADQPLHIIVDRLTSGAQSSLRLRDSLETASSSGDGRAIAFIETDSSAEAIPIDDRTWQRLDFSTRLECLRCNRQFADPEPRRFSFNSPLGACPTCEGAGEVAEVDGPRRAPRFHPCPTCHGTRLNEEALAWRVSGLNIAEIAQLKIDDVLAFLSRLTPSAESQHVARPLLAQLQSRLGFLQQVGLGYLTLDRMLRTLSGGEVQRVALTSALGSNLVNMLYVLDEPSVGLHPRDTNRLITAIERLKNRGNSVVVVEHEETILRAADQLIEIGPGAGDRGGEVVFQGSLQEMLSPSASLTGEFLALRRGISVPERRRPTSRGWIKLLGARGNNLQNLTVEFPLGVLCVVCGVSGAGKSTLIQDTLYPALCKRKSKDGGEPLPYDDVVGAGQIDDVILVDQDPIGRSPRSNPVTYIKAFDQIRAVFAETIEAKMHNYTAGHFSFNVADGRCDACEGMGYIQVDMQFMTDIFIKCGQCGGTRFRKEILAVKYRGRNIAEVLAMTVREAFGFFRGQPKVQARLKQLIDVGLDYLQLGQPANTLSSGEAQRLKLAAHLSEASRNRTLFLLDEPTTGLHFADVVTLLDCFEALLSVGHSLIVVEHNLQLMRAADYLVDLGPGAAEEGGRIVATGTPEQVASCQNSYTGHYLALSLAPASADNGPLTTDH